MNGEQIVKALEDRTDGGWSPRLDRPFAFRMGADEEWSAGSDGRVMLAVRRHLALADNALGSPVAPSLLGSPSEESRETTVETLRACGVEVSSVVPLVCAKCSGSRKATCGGCRGRGRATCRSCDTDDVKCHDCAGEGQTVCPCEWSPPTRYEGKMPIRRVLGVNLDGRRLWWALLGLTGAATADRALVTNRASGNTSPALRVRGSFADGTPWVVLVTSVEVDRLPADERENAKECLPAAPQGETTP